MEDIRSRLLQVPDVSKVDLIGAQPERIYIEFSPEKLAGYGLTPEALTLALQAQNVVVPSGEITTDKEGIRLQVSGALKSEKDILAVNFAVGKRIIRLADIAQVRREDADPPDPIFRVNGKPGLGLAISMRDGGDVLALGRNIQETMQELKKNLPVGIEPIMVADQPETVDHAIDDFMEALWEAIAIVLVGQHREPRLACGLRRHRLHSAGAGRRLRGDAGLRHRSSAHLARRPHHRARPAGGRRHDHGREHGQPPGARR